VVLDSGGGVLEHQKVEVSEAGPMMKGEEDRSVSSPRERQVAAVLRGIWPYWRRSDRSEVDEWRGSKGGGG
jgi:hypothetical protein